MVIAPSTSTVHTEPHRTIHEPISVHSRHLSPDISSFLGDVDTQITVSYALQLPSLQLYGQPEELLDRVIRG